MNTDKVARALLQYRNTPIRGVGLSPSQILYARELKDSIPGHKHRYQMRREWVLLQEDREKAYKRRLVLSKEQWARGTRKLPPLQCGDVVLVQNQYGAKSKAWEMSGVIVEVLPHDSYMVKLDGSHRISKRCRNYLKNIKPIEE